jgi:hypothetical protein
MRALAGLHPSLEATNNLPHKVKIQIKKLLIITILIIATPNGDDIYKQLFLLFKIIEIIFG